MKGGIKKILRRALIGILLFFIPTLLVFGILATHDDVSEWIGFIYFVFLFAEVAMLCSFRRAYAFVVKKPMIIKALLFGGVYYLLWTGFFFFMLIAVLMRMR